MSEKLIKHANGQWELLSKNNEDLEKALRAYRPNEKPRFEHGSTIHLNRAVTDPETNKTHGYEVHEHHSDGRVTKHPNVPYQELDSGMTHGRLRMSGEKSTKKHDLYHSATVEHSKKYMKNPAGTKGTQHEIRTAVSYAPHGEAHTKNAVEKNEVTGAGLVPTAE